MDEIKEAVFQKIKPSHIMDEYIDICEAIKVKVESL